MFPLLLCMIQGYIRIAYDLFRRFMPLFGKGYADTGAQFYFRIVKWYRTLHCIENTFGNLNGLGGFTDVVHQYDELVSPQPSDCIDVAHAVVQPMGRLFQDKIADYVAVGVIYEFEMVQIDKKDGEGHSSAVLVFVECVLQVFCKEFTVRQSRKGIMESGMPQFLLYLLSARDFGFERAVCLLQLPGTLFNLFFSLMVQLLYLVHYAPVLPHILNHKNSA